MKEFLLIDYKGGKHYVIQDNAFEMDFVIGKITKEEALKPEFVKGHMMSCIYYGIPCYCGDDPEMSAVYKELEEE